MPQPTEWLWGAARRPDKEASHASRTTRQEPYVWALAPRSKFPPLPPLPAIAYVYQTTSIFQPSVPSPHLLLTVHLNTLFTVLGETDKDQLRSTEPSLQGAWHVGQGTCV